MLLAIYLELGLQLTKLRFFLLHVFLCTMQGELNGLSTRKAVVHMVMQLTTMVLQTKSRQMRSTLLGRDEGKWSSKFGNQSTQVCTARNTKKRGTFLFIFAGL